MAAAYAREGGYGASASVIHVDSAHPHNAIIVPDAQLLFTGDFHRAGPDLVIIGHDGRHHIIPDYFAAEHRQALTAPNGAFLPPNVIDLLAGSPTPNEYAQAGAPTASADPIGTVEKVVGNVTVVRNGVAVALHVGDKVYQSDVVQTGSDSQVGIGFPDGTALNLVANTRMALNEYSYDPNSNNNSALISLVEGTFSFVAGKVAHTGDMKIQTPVATMGIRGTTGWVQELATVTANFNNNTYSFAVSPDYGTNQTGMYDLIDQSGNVIATVSQSGFLTLVTPQGIGLSPIVTTQPMTATQLQFEQQIVQEVFQTLNLINNPNPHSNPGSSGSGGQNQQNGPAQQLLKENGGTLNLNTPGENNGGNGSTQNGSGNGQNQPTPTAYWLHAQDGNWSNPLAWSDSWAPLSWQNLIINQPVTVTIDSSAGDSGPSPTAAASLLVGLEATLQIIGGGSLTVGNIVDVFGTIDVNSNIQDPTFIAQGPVTAEALGTIEAVGSLAAVYFSDITGATVTDINGNSTIYTIDNSGTILAGQSGHVFFEQAITKNEAGALIVAQSGGTIMFDGGPVNGVQSSLQNSGTVEAVSGGAITFDLGMLVDNTGTISAGGSSAAGGTITFDAATLTNEAGGLVEAQNGGTLTFDAGALDNSGTVSADGGTLSFEPGTVVTNEIGGLLIAENDGVLVLDAGNTITSLDLGLLEAASGGEIDVKDGKIYNSGATPLATSDPAGILLTGSGSTLLVDVNQLTLDGSGALALAGGTITGQAVSAGDALVNLNNIISGFGLISNLTVTNDATIVASGGTLTIDPSAMTNTATGTLEATNGGVLAFSDTPIVNSTGGQIKVDAGGTLTISGGSLTNTGIITDDGITAISNDSVTNTGGTFNVGASDTLTLTGVTFTGGDLTVAAGGTLNLDNAHLVNVILSDAGATINVTGDSSIDGVNKIISGDVTVDAGQTLVVDNSLLIATVTNLGTGVGAGTVKVDSGTTSDFGGTGSISGGNLINLGTINIIDPFSAISAFTLTDVQITNTGSLTVGDGAHADTLTLTGSTVTGAGSITVDPVASLIFNGLDTIAGGTVNATNATITVGGTLDLASATVNGGSVTNNGLIDVIEASTIDGATISGGSAAISTGVTLTLDNDTLTGLTISGGTVALDSAASTVSGATTIETATLQTGTLDVATGQTLTLDADTITGVTISGGTVTLDSATSTISGATTIETATLQAGTLDITTGQTLTLDGDMLTGLTISDGTVDLDGATSTVSGATTIENGTLQHGTLDVSTGVTLTLDDDSITGVTVSGGTIALDGAASTVSGATTVESATLQTGTLDVSTGVSLTLDDDSITGLTISGGTVDLDAATSTISGTTTIETATLQSGTFDVATGQTLTLDGDTLTGLTISGGTVALDSATSTVSGATTIENATLQTGTVDVSAGQTLTLDGDTITGVTISGGTVGLDSTTSTISGATTIETATLQTGMLDVSTGVTLTLDDDTISGVTISGGTVALDSATSTISGATTIETATLQNGTLDLASGQTLTLDDDAISGVTISGGTVALDSATSTISGATTIETATLQSGTLDVASGQTLTLDDDTISGVTISGGTVALDSATSTISGATTIDNATLQSGTLDVASGVTLTLDGDTVTGTTFTDTASGAILSIDANDTLTISGVTINGGTINDGTLASGATITVSGSSTIENADLDNGNVTVAGNGTVLTLDSDTVNGTKITLQSGGSLAVDPTVTLEGGATISGGSITNTGVLDIAGPATLSNDTLTNTGATLQVNASETLTVSGDTINGGTISIGGSGSTAGDLDVTGNSKIDGNATIDGGDVTLASGVTLTLDDVTRENDTLVLNGSATIRIDSGDTLTDAGSDTVTGSGPVTFSNSGTIVHTGSVTVDILNTTFTGSGTVIYDGSNHGVPNQTLINEGNTFTGYQTFGNGTVTETIDNASGVFDANVSGQAFFFENHVALTNAGTMEATGGGMLTFADAVTNTGAIIAGANTGTAAGTLVDISGTVTNSGNGAVTVTGALQLDGGTISGGTVTNSGSISTTTAGGAIDGATLDNSGSLTTGGKLTLDDTTINGGTITGANHGYLNVDTGRTLTLKSVTVLGTSGGTGELKNSGTVTVENGLSIDGPSFTVELVNAGAGVGTVSINGETIKGLATGEVFENDGNTIISTGTDQIGDGTTSNLTLDNAAGSIDVQSGTLTIETHNTITNAGTLEATSGGTLVLDDNVANTGGTIKATGTSSTVQLNNVTIAGGTLSTGHLGDSTDGLISVNAPGDSDTSVLDGSVNTVNVAGYVVVESGASLELKGTIDNTGTIDVDLGPSPPPTPTALEISGTVTLNGDGTVTLGGSSDEIVAAAAGATLDNANTISGSGQIGAGDNNLTLDNVSGTINATAGTLTIETGSNTIINTGTLEATNGATLHLESAVDNSGGTVQTSDGEIDIAYTGGSDDIIIASGGTVIISDDSLGNISGSAFGSGASVSATGGTLTVENGSSFGSGAHVTTEGSGTELTITDSTFGNNVAIDASGGSSLTIEDGAAFSNGDTVTLSSGSVAIDGTSIDGFGTLSGNLGADVASIAADGGTLDITGLTTGPVAATVDTSTDALTVGATGQTVTFGSLANAGSVEVSAGTLDVTGAVSGGGTTQIDANATFEIGSTDADTVNFNGGGTFVIDHAAIGDNGPTGDYTGTIGNSGAGDFVSGDTIDLKDVAYALGTETDVWSQSSGTLTIYSGTTAEASINLAGSYNQNDFELTGDGASGTNIVWNPSATTGSTTSFSAGSISFENGHWVENDGIVTLSGVDQVTIAGKTYLLVDDVGAGGYSTIQAAVNAATSSGDTILIAPGTYQEQVSVTNSAAGRLTIEGANGAGTVTVEAPTTLQETAISPTSQNPIDGIFTVDGVDNVTITGLNVNGLDYGDEAHFAPSQPGTGSEGPSLIGIAYVNAGGGIISSDTISGTDENDGGFGDQRNLGIYVVNSDPLAPGTDIPAANTTLNAITITNSSLSGFQKGGIVVEYADATISGNMLTGAGEVDQAQNGIQIDGSTGTVSNNTISNIDYVNSDYAATGILAFYNYGLDITGNSFTGVPSGNLESPVGVYVLDSTNGEIENNSATYVDNGVVGWSIGAGLTGTWTVSGNLATGVASDGGSIFWDPEPTSSGSFTVTGGATDVDDVFYLNPYSNFLTGGGGGGNTFVVVEGSDLNNDPAVDTIDGGGTGGNVIDFASGTSGDTLTVGSNVTDVQEVDVVGPTYAATDTTPLNVNIAAAPSVLTVVADDGGDTITGNDGNDTLTGGTGNDTFIVGSGNDSITGGGGHDVVQYDAALTASDITVLNVTQWQISEAGDGTDTLTGIQQVTDGTHTFLLVGDGAYSDVTAASAPGAAASGDTLIVDSGSDPSLQTVGTDNLTVDALASSTALDLQLGSGVQTLTLADYAPGQGANVTVTGNNLGDTITGNDGNDTFTGGTGNDSFILGTGTNSVTGGGGIDTVEVGSGYHVAIQSGQWVVTNGSVTDTLSGIDKVDIAGTTYDLVDKFGASGGFQSLQAAIDAAGSNDTILVAPGSYTESANYDPVTGLDDTTNGANPVGLLVDKSVTIEGVNSTGAVVTSASNTQATIVSSVESDWGTNFYVTANNVTITGLNFQASDLEAGVHQGIVNKAFEVIANNFTLQDSQVGAANGIDVASSVYFDDPNAANYAGNPSGFQSIISAFDIAHNILYGDFVETSGVGYGDTTTSLQLTDNEFSLNPGTSPAFGNIGVIVEGQIDISRESAWLLAPAVLPEVTGNTIDADYTSDPYGARFLAWDDNAANLPDASYIANYVADNNLGTYAYALTSGATPTPDYSTYDNTSYYYIYLNAGDASASGAANSGDTIVVESNGDTSVQTIGTDNLTIDALAGSNGLNLLLGTGVHTITLADYDTADHLGANVNVTGNGAGDTIVGNDGSNVIDPAGFGTLTGGGGADTFVYSNGYGAVTITDFDQGSGSFNQSQGDVVNLTKETSVGNFTMLQADAAPSGVGDANTTITFAPGDTLTLDNVTPAQLQNSDFIFAPLTAGTATLSGGVEGATAATLSAAFTAADLNAPTTDFSGTIAWGDGTTTPFTSAAVSGGNGFYAVNGSHIYAEEGSYTATVTINDDGGHTTTDTAATTVADAPLTAGTVTTGSVVVGTAATTLSATFTDANPGDNTGDFTASIAWGDGTTTSGAVSYNTGVYSVSGSHTYAAAGSDNVSVTITDDGGSSATDTGTAAVSAASPTVATSQQPASVIVGEAIADQATVSGGYNPTGTVTFDLYSSATVQNSSTLQFSDTESLASGTATSASYTTAATGTDYWVATYNGDANNNAVTSGATDEPVTITPPTGSSLDNWTGTAGDGEWSTAANWDNGVPSTNSEVNIAVSGAIVSLAVDSHIESLDVADDNTLNVIAGNSFDVSGTAQNAGAIAVYGATGTPATISSVTFEGSFTNSGDITVGQLATIGSSGSTVTIVTPGVASFEGAVINTGTIEASGGTLILTDGSVVNGGTLSIAGAGEVEIGSGGATFDGGLIVSNQGTITVESTAALTLGGATIEGGTITTSGSILVTGNSTIDDGASVSGSGSDNITVQYGETLTLGSHSHDSVTLTDVTVSDYGTVTVNGTLTLSSGSNVVSGGGGVGGAIVNNGTIDVTGSAIFESSANVSGGDITVASGITLTLDGVSVGSDITNNTGTVHINDTVTYSGTLTNASSGTAVTIDASATLSIAGAVISGGTITMDTGASIVVESTKTLTLEGATIDGGTIINNGTIDVSGLSTIDGHATVGGDVTVATGSTLTLDDVTFTGTLTAGSTSVVQVDASHTLWLNGASIVGGTLTNNGTIEFGTQNNDYIGANVGGGGSVNMDVDTAVYFAGFFEQDVTLSGVGALMLAQSAQYTATIHGYSDGALLNLADIDFISGTTTVTPNGADNLLSVTDGTNIANINIAGAGYDTTWYVLDDGYANGSGNDGTLVIDPNQVISDGASHALVNETASVLFTGSGGTLDLSDPSAFDGFIAGLVNSNDIVDLGGFNSQSGDVFTTTAHYDNGVTVLVVTDTDGGASENFTLAGDYANSNWTVTSDGSGGALVDDPPSAGSATEPSVLTTAASTATSDTVTGNLSFADNDPASAISASATPDGTDYHGSFTLDQPTESNGVVSVGFEFNDGQVNLTSGETLTQSYDVTVADAQNPAATTTQTVSVTIGGPGNDNFVFAPGVGADTVTNFNVQQDTLEFDHFASVQTAQELQALISTDAHGDAVINLGHNDSVTLVGVTDAQLQHVIQAGHVLLH